MKKLPRLLLLLSILWQNNLFAEDFRLCYDFGCKSSIAIELNAQQWKSINQIFEPAALSAWMEKQQIRQAIALIERYSGAIAGTDLDIGGNYNGEDLPRQQDCIDESTNTFQFLSVLQQKGLLRWHEVVPKQRRIVWFFTHWTAAIRETKTGQLYAVDSWYRDNGEPPYIQKLDDWFDRTGFDLALNP